MGIEFIARTLRTTTLVALMLFPFLLYYFGWWPGLAWLSGVVWGGLNLISLTSLVTNTLRTEKIDREKAAIVGIFKFTLLYGAGFALLMIDQFPIQWLLIGAGMPLFILVLKAGGRLLTGADNQVTLAPFQSSQSQTAEGSK